MGMESVCGVSSLGREESSEAEASLGSCSKGGMRMDPALLPPCLSAQQGWEGRAEGCVHPHTPDFPIAASCIYVSTFSGSIPALTPSKQLTPLTTACGQHPWALTPT